MTLEPAHTCVLCKKPISLEFAKVSEEGKPIHEECYVSKLETQKRAHAWRDAFKTSPPHDPPDPNHPE